MSTGPRTNGNGQIQPRSQRGQLATQQEGGGGSGELLEMLKSMGPAIARALPRHLTPDRMSRVVLTAVRVNPKLLECSKASFVGAIMSAAQLGLEPNTPLGHCYLIPFNDRRNKVVVCQLILGYQGMIDLALRSGRITSVRAVAVREGDYFDFEHGLHEKLVHRQTGNEDAQLTHAYAIARVKDGDPIFTVLSRPQIEKRRKRGASGHGISTPWDTDYEAMALKTAVRALWPWIPKSAEMAAAGVLEDAQDRGESIARALPEIGEALRGAGIQDDQPLALTGETRVEESTPREPGMDEPDPADEG